MSEPGKDKCERGHSWPREGCSACEKESLATSVWGYEKEAAKLKKENKRLRAVLEEALVKIEHCAPSVRADPDVHMDHSALKSRIRKALGKKA